VLDKPVEGPIQHLNGSVERQLPDGMARRKIVMEDGPQGMEAIENGTDPQEERHVKQTRVAAPPRPAFEFFVPGAPANIHSLLPPGCPPENREDGPMVQFLSPAFAQSDGPLEIRGGMDPVLGIGHDRKSQPHEEPFSKGHDDAGKRFQVAASWLSKSQMFRTRTTPKHTSKKIFSSRNWATPEATAMIARMNRE
jgi:hypothetical protein